MFYKLFFQRDPQKLHDTVPFSVWTLGARLHGGMNGFFHLNDPKLIFGELRLQKIESIQKLNETHTDVIQTEYAI